MPFCFLGLFRPGEWKMEYLTGLLGPLQAGDSLQQDLSLTVDIVHLAHGPSEGVFDACHPGNADLPMKFWYHGETYRGKALGLKVPSDQSHGPAAYGSGRGENNRLHTLIVHLCRNLRHGYLHENREVVLVSVE